MLTISADGLWSLEVAEPDAPRTLSDIIPANEDTACIYQQSCFMFMPRFGIPHAQVVIMA